jgi:hypothetical protein
MPADQSIIFHFSEYLVTTGGIYKSKVDVTLSSYFLRVLVSSGWKIGLWLERSQNHRWYC